MKSCENPFSDSLVVTRGRKGRLRVNICSFATFFCERSKINSSSHSTEVQAAASSFYLSSCQLKLTANVCSSQCSPPAGVTHGQLQQYRTAQKTGFQKDGVRYLISVLPADKKTAPPHTWTRERCCRLWPEITVLRDMTPCCCLSQEGTGMHALKMEAAGRSEILAYVYRTTQGHIAEQREQAEHTVCREQSARLQQTC